jgi:hypothetical protein
MVFLINIVPFLIIFFGGLVICFVPGWKRKVGTALIALGLIVLYNQIQPSYIPKGTVKALPNTAFHTVDKPIVDLLLKPKSATEYDAERNKALEEIDNSINQQIKLNKE